MYAYYLALHATPAWHALRVASVAVAAFALYAALSVLVWMVGIELFPKFEVIVIMIALFGPLVLFAAALGAALCIGADSAGGPIRTEPAEHEALVAAAEEI